MPGNRQDRRAERTLFEFPNIFNFRGDHTPPPIAILAVVPIRTRDRSGAHIGKLDQLVTSRIGESDRFDGSLVGMSPKVCRKFLLEDSLSRAIDDDFGILEKTVIEFQHRLNEEAVKRFLVRPQIAAVYSFFLDDQGVRRQIIWDISGGF